MIRKYKGKPLTVPLAASVIAFGLALSAGCDEKTTTSTSSATHTVAPKGTVSGHVQDTNGNPVAGATVNLAGQTKTTDASGQYVFTNVPVTNVAGTDAGGTGGSNLVIVITPPATSGYLGSTVTVNPLAAIEGQNDGNNGQTTTGTHLVSGFSVQAGTAVLPKMGSSVSGVLRDNQTNLPVANTVVTLDLTAVQTANASGGPAGNDSAIGSTIRAPLMQVTTGADGSFSFPSVPSDSVMRISAVGYTINSVQTPGNGGGGADRFGTNDEDRQQVVGDVMATKTISADTAAPVVRNVTGSVLVAGGPHNLSHDGSTITLQFSEPVTYTQGATIAQGDVLVYDTVARRYVNGTAALSADGKSLVFTTDATTQPAPGSVVNVNMNRAAFSDAATNWLNVNGADALANVSGKIGALDGIEDGLGALVGAGAGFVQVQVRTYRNPAIAGGPVLTQQAGTAATGDRALLGIGGDVDAVTANIQQLNARDDDNGNATADTVERINALIAAAGLGAPNLDVAQGASATLVTFPAVTGAVAYNVSMTRSGAALNVDGSNVTVVSPAGGTNPSTTVYRFLAPANTATVGVVLNSVRAGDSVVVAAEDSLGNLVPGVLSALVDNVAPIPTLQNGYGVVGAPNNVLVTGGGTVGNGAELVVTTAGGTLVGPVFPVTAGLLANPTLAPGAGSALSAQAFGFADIVGTTLGVTTTLITQAAYNGATGAYIYAPTRAVATTAGDSTIDQWLSAPRTMGVSFSEDVLLTGTPAFNGSTALSGWAVANDITADIMGGAVNVDLLSFTGSVNGLQGDHNKIMNFGNAVTDRAGNAAPSSSVIVRDYLPPFITSATIADSTPNDGLITAGTVTITLSFNEAVAPDSQLGAATPINIMGLGGAVVQALIPSATAPGQTYTITSDRRTMIFTLPANPFTAGNRLATYGAPNPIDIFAVEFNAIPDAVAVNGAYNNKWANTGQPTPHAGATYRE